MAISRYPIIPFSIFTLVCLLSLKNEAAPTYRFHACTTGTNYTANSTYSSNLNLLLSSLSSNSTQNLAFYNLTAGTNTPDAVNGLFLCRGDVSSAVCQDCVPAAAMEILRRCPVETEAIIWYDECMLRYSDRSIFSTSNEVPSVGLPGETNMTDKDRFEDVLGTMLNGLITTAANSESGKKFATAEEEFTSSQTIYSLVQCTPDLTTSDCYRCFRSAVGAVPNCCAGKQGARVLLPSCSVRYELYPFYNSTAASPPQVIPPRNPGRNTASLIVAISVLTVFLIALIIAGYKFLRNRASKRYTNVLEGSVGEEIPDAHSLQFHLDTIEIATHKFSDDNKIGEGGFGAVYKGTLSDGQEIAVKRLSTRSLQGAAEFKNEAVLVSKLQHRNLVRLLGFCMTGQEKLLVYEYVPNYSLDYFLIDPERRKQLNWSRRYKIIGGIARGILYLHEDSQLTIIHRDLKASNVLLDANMNPKISDFGIAKTFVLDQTRGSTKRIVGTYGYMSPEYAMHGKFSVKSDVFSFGVLVLEIISGKRNASFLQSHNGGDLLSFAWKHWKDRTPLELLDPLARGSYSRNEVLRCIHIGLLCIEENPRDRPSMKTISLMLNSSSVTLPLPQLPASLMRVRKYEGPLDTPPLSYNDASLTEVYPR